jgi:hypothetical protein
MTAIDADRTLLRLFLRELVKTKSPTNARRLQIREQQYPWASETREEEPEREGIPDGWIFNDDGWCVFIESKVLIPLTAKQILTHRHSAKRRGFRVVTAVAIVAHRPTLRFEDVVLLEWRDVYSWLCRHRSRSEWAARAADFLEIMEAKLIGTKQFKEGSLTKFSGIPFGHKYPYAYLEAKRVLALALEELRSRRDLKTKLGMNPNVLGRSAITGSQSDTVWNFLSLSSARDADNFTKYPHLTLGITSSSAEVMVTVPNAVSGGIKRNLKDLDEDGFQDMVEEIVQNMTPLLRRHPGVTPWFRGVQRRYRSQRATPYIDARIDFDLRTAIRSGGPPKTQPNWLSAAYGSFVKKRGSNYQIQIGAIFRYDRCPELRSADAIGLLANTWLACKPLINLMR